MPTTALVQRRKWFRLPASIPATFRCRNAKQQLNGKILDISENGIGFTVDDNIQDVEQMTVQFWLPFDLARPNAAMLEPIVATLTPVSSRYCPRFDTYAYGAVFLGLGPGIRSEIRAYLRSISTAA